MEPLSTGQAFGNVVDLARTNPRHLNSSGVQEDAGANQGGGFGSLVASALGRVSDGQMAADTLFERMITNPDDVEPHDVTIAMAQAEMSLNMTKAIVDRAVKAYNDITAMR